MPKKDSLTQEKVNAIFETAARAAYDAFGFNPTAILGFEMSPASDLYISPELPGAKSWFYLKAPVGNEALVFNMKSGEILLVESEDSWAEKTQKQYSKITKSDQKAWKDLTGKELGTPKGAKKAAAKKAAAKKAPRKAPKKAVAKKPVKKTAKKASSKRK